MKLFTLRSENDAKLLWGLLGKWKDLSNKGKPFTIIVYEFKEKRNTEQNKRYWEILRQIAYTVWIDGKQYSQDAWHEHYKRKFIGIEEIPGGIQGISTTTLSVKEFSEYCDKIEYDAIELGAELIIGERNGYGDYLQNVTKN